VAGFAPKKTEEEVVQELSRDPDLQAKGKEYLDQAVAEFLKSATTDISRTYWKTWKSHAGSRQQVVDAARQLFLGWLERWFPDLSVTARQRIAGACLVCHYGLDGDGNVID
jgi:hypothetical protein